MESVPKLLVMQIKRVFHNSWPLDSKFGVAFTPRWQPCIRAQRDKCRGEQGIYHWHKELPNAHMC